MEFLHHFRVQQSKWSALNEKTNSIVSDCFDGAFVLPTTRRDGRCKIIKGKKLRSADRGLRAGRAEYILLGFE